MGGGVWYSRASGSGQEGASAVWTLDGGLTLLGRRGTGRARAGW